jgi:hypothetical protein
MARIRPILVAVLIFLWTVTPALSCLAKAGMTEAEMACCKKMAGDCHMGPEHHPCCDMRLNTPPQVATVVKNSHFQPAVVFVMASLPAEFVAASHGDPSYALQGLPPPAPPGLNSILRI